MENQNCFVCPSHAPNIFDIPNKVYGYVIPNDLDSRWQVTGTAPQWRTSPAYKLRGMKNPTNVAFLADSVHLTGNYQFYYVWKTTCNTSVFHLRHSGARANVLLADNHVESMNRNQIVDLNGANSNVGTRP